MLSGSGRRRSSKTLYPSSPPSVACNLHEAIFCLRHEVEIDGACRGGTRGVQGGDNSRASKSPNNVTSTFFNTVHLLPKDLRFEHGGAKLASCPGRHLTSLRPWIQGVLPAVVLAYSFWFEERSKVLLNGGNPNRSDVACSNNALKISWSQVKKF